MRNNPLGATDRAFTSSQNDELRRSGLQFSRNRRLRHPGRVIASSNIFQPVLQPWVLNGTAIIEPPFDVQSPPPAPVAPASTPPIMRPQAATSSISPTPNPAVTPGDSGESFRQRAVVLALQEWRAWQQGRIKETDPGVRQRLSDYWITGTGSARHEADWPSRVPWSAAFISWIMRRAGAGRAFQYSAAHVNYIIAAKNNRLQNNRNPFKAYRTTEVAPRVGDLVCKDRAGSNATYDNLHPGMKTHCDIVVEVRPGSVVTIGGNVSNSVSQTIVRTDARGFVIAPGYFAIIRVGR